MNKDSRYNPNNNSYNDGIGNNDNSNYDKETFDNPYRNNHYQNSNIYDSSSNYGTSDGIDTSLQQPYKSEMINKSMPYEIDLDNEFVDSFGYDNGGSYPQPTYQDDTFEENIYPNEGYDNTYNDTAYQDNTYQDNMYQDNFEQPYQNEYNPDEYVDGEYMDEDFDEDDLSAKPDKKSPKYKRMKWLFIFESFAIVVLCIGIYFAYNLSKLKGLGTDIDDEKIQVDTSVKKEGYLTIALLGLDAADKSGSQRSDSIMIANINQSTGDIQLVSVYRDTFVYIEGYKEYIQKITGSTTQPKFTKVNAAYNMGVESTLLTLNYNLSLDIHNYISVDFSTLAGLVDALGGIEVTMPDVKDFGYFVNKYGREAAQAEGDSFTPLKGEIAGKTLKLNGYQALGYSRVRKATDYDKAHGHDLPGTESDLTRAARQKEVIGKILEGVKAKGITKVSSIAETFSSENSLQSTYNISELIGLATDAIENDYHIAEGEKISFPLNPHNVDMWKTSKQHGTSTQFCEYTLLDDVKSLHAYLYPDKELTDKELTYVKKISEQLEVYEAKYAPFMQKTKPAETTNTDAATTGTTQ